MRQVFLALALSIPVFCHGQDSLLFTSGKEYECEVIKFEGNVFTVRLPDGSLKQAPSGAIKQIIFAQHERTTPITASTNSPPKRVNAVFRNTAWGMTKEEVKQAETAPLFKEDEDSLAFNDTVSGLETLVLYIFVDNRLVRTKYIFVSKHSNDNDYLSDYGVVGKALAEKYGKATEQDKTWKKDLYRNDPKDWGMAVSAGHLILTEQWDLQHTTVFHALYGDNYRISHVVEYQSKLLASLEESRRSKSDKEKL